MRFKIRASACGHIMGGNIGLPEGQKVEINKLKVKSKDKGMNSLTDKQLEIFMSISHKRDNPQLPQGAKTYCEDWLKGQLYNRKREISSKYTYKGQAVEDESIEYIAEQLHYGMLFKNEDHFENSHIKGTPDIITTEVVLDAKNVWDQHTFPLFDNEIPNPDYYWQGQCYMELVGIKKYRLVYVLSDTPEELIEKEFRSYCYANFIEADADVYAEFEAKMTYSDVPDNLKIKTFDFDYDEKAVKEIYKRVDMCRDYIIELSKPFA